VPLYSMGSRMVASYGLGPVVHGLGLFQPVLSYNNKITISAVSDRAMMPDPAFYVECLQKSYDELKAATIEKPKKAPRKKAARKTATSKSAPSGNGTVHPPA
jgi:diacylglycerol O-acyltransferase / wax synthase